MGTTVRVAPTHDEGHTSHERRTPVKMLVLVMKVEVMLTVAFFNASKYMVSVGGRRSLWEISQRRRSARKTTSVTSLGDFDGVVT